MNQLTSVLLCFVLVMGGRLVRAQTQSAGHVDGHLYLKVLDSSTVNLAPYNSGIPALNLLVTQFGIDTIYRPFQTVDPALGRIYRLEFSLLGAADLLITQLQALPFVEFAEKVPLMRPTYTPNDFHALQWHLDKVNAGMAWDYARGSSGVVIAVVDNAVAINHVDLQPVLWRNLDEVPGNGLDDDLNGYADDVHGADVANWDGNPSPPAFGAGTQWDHGTHCAGIAAAATDNGTGIASLGFGVSLMAVKAGPDLSNGDALTRSYEGVDYALNAGADIISMSWGGASSLTGNLLLTLASSRGVILVASAGNDNTDGAFYPAAYAQCIGVGSTDQQDLKSGFSNYGQNVDVMAPGSNIYSTLATDPHAYGNLSGTSMACPLVAGLAGLLRSQNPGMSAGDVRMAIESTCVNIDGLNANYAGELGAGRIDAGAALASISTGAPGQGVTSSGLAVFPNPANEGVYWKVEGGGACEVFLYTLQGQLLLRKVSATGSGFLELEGVQAGSYVLQVEQMSRQVRSYHRIIKH